MTAENLPDPSSTKKNSVGTMMGILNVPKPNLTPWKEKKFGYIPFPKTDSAKFLNEKVLPSFYKCQWPWSKNAKSFVQGFHAEGRRQYDHHSKLKGLQESITHL